MSKYRRWTQNVLRNGMRYSVCKSCGRRTCNRPSPSCSEPKHQVAYSKARARHDKWYQKEDRREYMKKANLKGLYGISLDDFEALWAKQRGRCAIVSCRRPLELRAGGYAIDHNHTSGKVRGILCTPCNLALGWYENENWTKGVKAYLATS